MIQIEEKDFIVELARAVDIIDTCGIHKSEVTITFQLTAQEFERVYFNFSKKITIFNKKPDREFRVNFSGVEVIFKNIS